MQHYIKVAVEVLNELFVLVQDVFPRYLQKKIEVALDILIEQISQSMTDRNLRQVLQLSP